MESSSNARGVYFDLSFQTLKNVMRAKKCYFTGIPLDRNNRTVDRVNNKKGYVKGNVVACQDRFNMRKGALTFDDIELLYKKLKKRGDI
jgi:hypothetical protein